MTELVDFVKSFPLQSFDKDTLLVSEGEVTEEILFIREGFVKATRTNDNGSQRIIWIAGRYDIVPSESFFFSRAHPDYDYVSLSSGNGYRVEKKHFLEYAAQHPNAMTQMANAFGDHYDSMLHHVDAISQSTIRDKIVALLHSLTTRFCTQPICDLHELGLIITHQDIADMVGATRESVSLELKRIKDEMLIDYTRSSFTVYVDKLATYMQSPASV